MSEGQNQPQIFSKKVFLNISQISQENSRSLFFINFIKKRPQHNCFHVKFAKYLRTTFFTEHLQ